MTHVLIAAAGAPSLLSAQLAAIRRFLPSPVQITVVDDSRRRPHVSNDHRLRVHGAMRDVALGSGAHYLRFPQWLHFARWRLYPGRTRHWSPNPSPRTADTLQYGLSHLQGPVTRLLILDSDMVPIRPIDLDALVASCPVWLLPQERPTEGPPLIYPWPGLFLADLTQTAPLTAMSWDCTKVDGVSLDTGGAMRGWIARQDWHAVTGLHSGTWFWRRDAPSLPNALHAFLDLDADQNGGFQYCELFEGAFLHMRAGSNWNGMDPGAFERRRTAFVTAVQHLVSAQ